MKVIKFLLIMVLTVSIGSTQDFQDDCKKVEAEVTIENTSDGKDNGKVTINLIKGDVKSAKYIFCEAKGKVLNQEHLENKSLEGLKKGSYICIINTSECTKKINFKID